MPSLHHGAIFIGAFLIVTGGSTAFLSSYQSRLQAFSLCCVVLGVVMLILGLFWAMNSKSAANYNHQDFDQECPHYPYNDYPNFSSHALFTQPGSRFPESQSVFLPRWVQEKMSLDLLLFYIIICMLLKSNQFNNEARKLTRINYLNVLHKCIWNENKHKISLNLQKNASRKKHKHFVHVCFAMLSSYFSYCSSILHDIIGAAISLQGAFRER